ncbi:unnamed protein product [Eretmochelys imbricata]
MDELIFLSKALLRYTHQFQLGPNTRLRRNLAALMGFCIKLKCGIMTVKDLIVHSPVIAVFSPALPTIVTTDASDYGLGDVLTQLHEDNTERTVAFASRTLSNAERKYSTVEKEALACIWATEKWRTYLWGCTFKLRTDHSPLTTLLTTKGWGRAGYRIARWSARLLSFNYELEYKPGNQNVVADCLSRLPLPSPDAPTEDDVRKTVEQNQAKYKAFTDQRQGAKGPKFQCGSFVRIRKPGILCKGDHKFTAPLKIVEKKGPYTYRLSDGQVWNASYLAPAYAPRGDYANTQSALDDFTVVSTQQNIALEPGLERLTVRPRRPPV